MGVRQGRGTSHSGGHHTSSCALLPERGGEPLAFRWLRSAAPRADVQRTSGAKDLVNRARASQLRNISISCGLVIFRH